MKRTLIVPIAAALVASLTLLGGCKRGDSPPGSPTTAASAPDMSASMPAPRASGG